MSRTQQVSLQYLINNTKGKLQRLVATRLGEEDWYLQRTCSGCEFFGLCSKQAIEEKDLSFLGISKHYKIFMNGVMRKVAKEVDADATHFYDIEEAHTILHDFFSDAEKTIAYLSDSDAPSVSATSTPVKSTGRGRGTRSTPVRGKRTPKGRNPLTLLMIISSLHPWSLHPWKFWIWFESRCGRAILAFCVCYNCRLTKYDTWRDCHWEDKESSRSLSQVGSFKEVI